MVIRNISETKSPLINYIEQFMVIRNATSIQYWNESTRFQAPHKTILLLACIDLIGEGHYRNGLIETTPVLVNRYKEYWVTIFPGSKVGNIAYPFFHFRTSPFWRLIAKPGKETVMDYIREVNSLSQLNELITGAQLDPELFELIQSEKERDILRAVIAGTYFHRSMQPKVIQLRHYEIDGNQYD